MTNSIKAARQGRDELKILIIGNPDNRRVQMFQHALENHGGSRAVVVPWIDLLQRGGCLDGLLHPGTAVRIESPGEDFAVEKELIALGHERSQQGESISRSQPATSHVKTVGFYTLISGIKGFALFWRKLKALFPNPAASP